MISFLKTPLTLLLLSACFVKNGLSLTDEQSFGEPIEENPLEVESNAEGKAPEDVADMMGREARAAGNSHFLRSLRAPSQHFLRSLKKRGIKSGGNVHFLRSLRESPESEFAQLNNEETEEDEIVGKNEEIMDPRSTRSKPGQNLSFLRPLRGSAHFLRSLRAPSSHFLRSLRSDNHARSLRGSQAHFLRSLRAPSAHFLRSLRAPSAHFLRSLRAPEAHFLRSLRAPEAHFLRSLRAPSGHFLRSLRAPSSHFLRSLRAPEAHFLRSLRAGGHFLRSLRSPMDGKRAQGHFLRSLRAPAGSSFLRSLREDPYQVDFDDEDNIPSDELIDGQDEFDILEFDGSSSE